MAVIKKGIRRSLLSLTSKSLTLFILYSQKVKNKGSNVVLTKNSASNNNFNAFGIAPFKKVGRVNTTASNIAGVSIGIGLLGSLFLNRKPN